MNKDIALYIDGKKIEWNKTPDILLTYQRTDYTNPTIVKNMFSKTITIDGTPNNNNIFNHIWKLDRIMDDMFSLYNPSQRVPFELYNGAELVESGYAKLDSIGKDGYKIGYNITLFGGLGSFFYSLAYDNNTDKEKTLADLNYTNTSNPNEEFNFEINKNTVWNAWDALKNYGNNSGSYRKWDFINFCPAYNGLPDDFDSDRVLLNQHGLKDTKVRYTDSGRVVNGTFPSHISDSENTYGTMNGYVNASMMRECDEWEMRDLRSYLQRPCLSVKGLFEAICNPQNNGGYYVNLDPDFFSSGNPYYSKAWITLPMLKPETNAVDEVNEWRWFKSAQYNYSIAPYTGQTTHVKWKLANISPIEGIPDTFSMDVELHTTITGATANTLYTSAMVTSLEYDPIEDESVWNEIQYFGCMAMQMYGFGNGTPWYNKNAKCGSNLTIFTSKVNGNYIGKQAISNYYSIPYNEVDINYNFGYWRRVSGNDFVWHNETDNTDIVHIQMDTNLMSEIPNIGISFGHIMTLDGAHSAAHNGWLLDKQIFSAESMVGHWFKMWDTLTFNNIASNTINKVNGKFRSFQNITKKDILGGIEGTPCDWMLSYCKLFGLFIDKDKNSNTINIRLRNNWYNDEIVDLDSLIDRSKDIKVNPLTFESKWYNFNYNEANGKFLDKYLSDYSQDFGKQLIDTKYNFDADEINILEDTKFRNGMTVLEKSNYFNKKTDSNGNQIPQCLFNWCTVTYYNGTSNTLDTEMCLPQNANIIELNPNMPKTFSDAYPKIHFMDSDKSSTDGDGVLVFYNGMKDTGNANYWISDDIDEMFIGSDNPCWLQTVHEWSVEPQTGEWIQRIAIQTTSLPDFGRYVTHNRIITATWDFGYTKELYVPYYRYDIDRTPTLYENFWKSYIQDLYSVNTRNVECYVALETNNIDNFMKKFYWWDDCLWVCTKVSDFDICLDRSTLCSFTKVNDKAAYLEKPTFDDYFFNFYRIDGGGDIPAQGTDEERSIYFSLDSSSRWVVYDVGNGYASFSPDSQLEGGYATNVEIKSTLLPNYSYEPRYNTYIAGNQEGQAIYIHVKQEGYVKEKYLNIEPSSVVLPRIVNEPVEILVHSSADWEGYPNSWTYLQPESGHSGTTTVLLSASTNNSSEQRQFNMGFRNDDSISARLNVKQKGNATVTLEQNSNGWPITVVPASGRSVSYRIVNDVECTIEPKGNTANFCIASGLVSYHTTVQPSNGTNFYFVFLPNSGTVTRNAAFFAQYQEDGLTYQAIPTVVQLPLVQEASGNTVVQVPSSGDTKNTTLGASLEWKATSNNRWINLITESGSSSDSYVRYTVASNNGAFRTGYIYVTYTDEMGYYCNETIVVEQQGGYEDELEVYPESIYTGPEGGQYVVSVTAGTSFDVSISDKWIKLIMESKNGNFTLLVEKNDNFERNADVIVTAGEQAKTIHVNQKSGYVPEYELDYSPEKITLEASGGSQSVTIRSNSNWEITEGNELEK